MDTYKDSDYIFKDTSGNTIITTPEYCSQHVIVWAVSLSLGFFVFMNLILWAYFS
jgi:hypothetical protein